MRTPDGRYHPAYAMDEVSDPHDDGAPPRGDAEWLRFMCHELRQPLVVALGYVSMLGEGTFGELPDEARAILTTVAGRLEAMNVIIERIATDDN